MTEEKKLHWYNFCFSDIKAGAEQRKSASVSVDNENGNITQSVINDVRSGMKVSNDAVLVSVSYLGYMTNTEFEI